MKYVAARKSTGRVVDMRDVPYTDEDLKALTEAYGETLVVHEDLDTSCLDGRACDGVKVDEQAKAIVDDPTAVDIPRTKDVIVELYRTRLAMKAAMEDGLDLSDELEAIEERILEVAKRLPQSLFSDRAVPPDAIQLAGSDAADVKLSFFARWAARLKWW